LIKVEREGSEVLVRVKDKGKGIAPEMLSRIFELFVQSRRALVRAHGGLGIGLTLALRLVKLRGGTVEAFSEGIGRGSEFVVRLPICPPPATSLSNDEERTLAARSSRILIIDDNVDSAQMMAMLQQMRGHVTCVAHSGPDGLNAAKDFLPEVARRLRVMPETAKAFIIAASGYGAEEDIARGNEAGFDEHMVKPVKMDILNQWLAVRWSS
jgi:CheY-like chemotaxis protein